ncbi:hypothetical protein NX059_011944 [Plenodomus lindquistii]|nr:hypothetical protein NX059_011944 [Plenodomus lindquistii]
MAEVFVFVAAIQATTQLMEQAFRILERLRKAQKRTSALFEVLSRHEGELRSVKAIVGIIIDEEDLQTATIATELARLEVVQTKLTDLLIELDPKLKSKASQFRHQLIHGSADEKKLSVIMDDLAHVKSALLLRVTIANVGVMSNVEKQLVANTAVIERIDEYLREEIENCEGLRIARLLKDRRPWNDTTIPLTPADLRSLRNEHDDQGSDDGTLVDDSETPSPESVVKTERIIIRNVSRNQAIQINAAIGKDLWSSIDRLVVRDNVAEDDSMQFNHAMELDVALKLFACRDAPVMAVPQRPARKRHDSVLGP